MMIHPSAIVAPSAEFGKHVEIGAFAIVEENARIGEGTRIRARAHICAGAVLGKNCDIHMNAVIGHVPQDFSYKGDAVHTVLGDGVVARENVTIHGGSAEKPTRVGDKCFLMVGSHIAHNCNVGRNVILANGALLAGHVQVDDGAVISGNVVIHQFVRVGKLAMLSGGSRFGMDVPPYLIGDGTNCVTTLNKVGLRRAPFLSAEDRDEIKRAYKLLYRTHDDWRAALPELQRDFKTPAVKYWLDFLLHPTPRGFCRHVIGNRRRGEGEHESGE